VAAATARVQRGIAVRAVATFGLPRDVDPFDALSAELARTQGHVDWLGEIIADMDPEELAWGKTLEEVGKGTGQKEGNTAKIRNEASPSVWLTLYQQERKHLVRVSEVCIAAGIAEREVTLLESQGRLIADLLRNVFDDPELALDGGTRHQMMVVASRHLRSVGT
jgi:hypothetical protein